MVAHASPSAEERTEADRVWFAVLFPAVTSFIIAWAAIAILARDDLSKEPLLSLAAFAFIACCITIPAVVINAIAFRKGSRSRGAWFARGVLAAAPVTLVILGVLVGFFQFAQIVMAH